MNTQQTIANLIKSMIHRAIRESAAGVLVIFAFTYSLQHSVPNTARYYGCLLVLVSAAFVLGVIWSYTLSYHLLVFASAPGQFPSVVMRIVLLGALFAGVSLLKRAAANKLDKRATTLAA